MKLIITLLLISNMAAGQWIFKCDRVVASQPAADGFEAIQDTSFQNWTIMINAEQQCIELTDVDYKRVFEFHDVTRFTANNPAALISIDADGKIIGWYFDLAKKCIVAITATTSTTYYIKE